MLDPPTNLMNLKIYGALNPKPYVLNIQLCRRPAWEINQEELHPFWPATAHCGDFGL